MGLLAEQRKKIIKIVKKPFNPLFHYSDFDRIEVSLMDSLEVHQQAEGG